MNIKKTIAVMILILILVMSVVIGGGLRGILAFWDAPSLLFLLIPLISVLVLSDNLSDFIRGFRIVNGNTEFTIKEFKASKNAYDMTIKVVFILSVLGTMIGLINMGAYNGLEYSGKELELYIHLYAGASIAVLTILYGSILNIFFYAIRSRIAKEIIYREG